MNERNQELVKQARAYANTQSGACSFSKNDIWLNAFEAKIVELTVRECARVSERTGALNEADYEGEMIADAIREHFGVQE